MKARARVIALTWLAVGFAASTIAADGSLVEAARRGELERVRSLVADGAEVSQAEGDGNREAQFSLGAFVRTLLVQEET